MYCKSTGLGEDWLKKIWLVLLWVFRMIIRIISLSGYLLKVQVKKMKKTSQMTVLGDPRDYATFPPTPGWEGDDFPPHQEGGRVMTVRAPGHFSPDYRVGG